MCIVIYIAHLSFTSRFWKMPACASRAPPASPGAHIQVHIHVHFFIDVSISSCSRSLAGKSPRRDLSHDLSHAQFSAHDSTHATAGIDFNIPEVFCTYPCIRPEAESESKLNPDISMRWPKYHHLQVLLCISKLGHSRKTFVLDVFSFFPDLSAAHPQWLDAEQRFILDPGGEV